MKKAVLIIHGFVGCLYDNEYLMNYLEFDRTFDVFCKTLPGHSHHKHYKKVSYKEWIDFLKETIEDLINNNYKTIYLIGHSMGGVLATNLACEYKQIKKVVLLNAAFNYLNLEQNKIDLLQEKNYKDYVEVFEKVLHTSIPFFLEFVKLVKESQDVLKQMNKETLILQSTLDQVVPLENGNIIFNNLKSDKKHLTYLRDNRHIVFDGCIGDLERKKEIAEYIRLFLRGGFKWKLIKKEKI